MSTEYALRQPLTISAITEQTRWTWWENEHGTGFTNDKDYIHAGLNDQGEVFGFTRYGMNDPTGLVDALDAVSEHDVDDPDYKRLFYDSGKYSIISAEDLEQMVAEGKATKHEWND